MIDYTICRFSVMQSLQLSYRFTDQPGATSLSAFVTEYDRAHDPTWQAAKINQRRAEKAEKEAARMAAALDKLNRQTRQANQQSSTSQSKNKRRSNIKWRRCPKCSTMVELQYGLNEIATKCQEHAKM